ncbi:C69 family dipeptidase, partial [Bacteroidota bacterium]
LIEFCEENKLRNHSEGKFNFAKAFGGGRENRFYDTRRVWRGISLLSDYKTKPDETYFPMFVKPKAKIDIKIMFDILRDKYENTPFELIKDERTICIHRTVHSSIVQLRDWLPDDIGAVLWTGLSVPVASVYIPFYYGIGEINPNYNSFSKENSAFWKFRKLYKRTEVNPDYVTTIRDEFDNIERKIVSKQTEMEETALEFFNSDRTECVGFLTYYVNGLCEIALKEAGELLNK